MSNEPDDITRREFVSRTATAVAGVALGGAAVARAQSGTVGSRVLGANDRVVLANIGIRGQGNALKRGFAKLKNVEIKTLCDIDGNLFPSRANDERLKDVATFKPGYVQDLRRVLDDKDVDAILVATPNHWHALATIWGLQAGKHVFVEKPASHTVWEGRKMFEASRKYNRLVQVGTMNRSRPIVQDAIKFMRDGGIGEIYMARGLCFKARPNIGKYPDGPMAPGEKYKLNVEAKDYEPTYDSAYLAKVDYDMWLGPAPLRPFNRNRFHYNWHWHWDYGNGDVGNQGVHETDMCLWGLGLETLPSQIVSMGGKFLWDDDKETPEVLSSNYYFPATNQMIEFEVRPWATNTEGGTGVGNIFYGSEGYLVIKGYNTYEAYLGREGKPGPKGKDGEPVGKHFANFIEAVRSHDPSLLHGPVETAHTSSALAHLGNIAYRLGRRLKFDPATECFVGDSEADALLTREYRKPFVVPEQV